MSQGEGVPVQAGQEGTAAAGAAQATNAATNGGQPQYTLDLGNATTQALPGVAATPPSNFPEQPQPLTTQDLLRIPGVSDLVSQVREEEKGKLYTRLEELNSQVGTLSEAEQARRAAEEEARAAAEAAEEAARQAELTLEQRIAELSDQFQQREKEMNDRLAAQQAVFEQERQAQAVAEYRQQVLTQIAPNVLPELLDMVGGATQEQIDASAQDAINRTQSIIGNVQQARVPGYAPGAFNPSGMPRGNAVTAPSMGPLDEQANIRSLTARGHRTDVTRRVCAASGSNHG